MKLRVTMNAMPNYITYYASHEVNDFVLYNITYTMSTEFLYLS